MILTTFTRPNNYVVNRLGFGSTWRTLLTRNLIAKSYGSIFSNFFRIFVHSIFRLGEIWKKNPFLHYIYCASLSTMMPDIKYEHVSKFLRLVRMKRDNYHDTRKTFNIRKYLHYLLMSDLFFYRSGPSIIALMYAHIPEPIKRFKIYKDEDLKRVTLLKNSINTRKNNIYSGKYKPKLYKLLTNLLKFNLIYF